MRRSKWVKCLMSEVAYFLGEVDKASLHSSLFERRTLGGLAGYRGFDPWPCGWQMFHVQILFESLAARMAL